MIFEIYYACRIFITNSLVLRIPICILLLLLSKERSIYNVALLFISSLYFSNFWRSYDLIIVTHQSLIAGSWIFMHLSVHGIHSKLFGIIDKLEKNEKYTI